MPGSTFEHRCFVQSLCAWEISLILDLAGEFFTELGRNYLMRKIAENALAAIQYNIWKHEYLFDCNQLAWFTPGRMLGSCLLERHWPRARNHTEQTYKDVVENINRTILPDGGYVEGPTYFTCIGHHAGLAGYVYAKRSNLNFSSVMPDLLRKTKSFAEAIASTDPSRDVIPICDARDTIDQDTLAIMAYLLPKSRWAEMFRKSVARGGGFPNSMLALALEDKIPYKKVPLIPFVHLPVMGLAASVRKLDSAIVKILMLGNKAGAGHTHEDKGSFVLEFAGEIFAIDPGTCDYSSPYAGILKNCERHNMLVPFGTIERPSPACPIFSDIKLKAYGNIKSFHSSANLTPGWEKYYKKWIRKLYSPSPASITIKDSFELKKGKGVEFYWNTRLPVSIKNGRFVITGKNGIVTIIPPSNCELRIDTLPLPDGVQNRCVIKKTGKKGELTVNVALTLK